MDSSRQLREAARKHLKVLLAQSAKAQRPTLGVALVVALLAWPALLTFFQGTRVLPTHSFLVRPVPSNGVSQKPHVTVPMHALEQPAPSGQTPSDSEGSSSKTEPEILSQEQILPSSGLSSPLETSSEDPGALILPGAAQASDASTLESLQDKRAGGTTGLHLDLNSEGQASPQASDSGALTPVVSSRGEGGGAVSIRAGGLEPEEPGPRAKLAFLFLTRVVPPLLPLWERFFKVRPELSHPSYKLFQNHMKEPENKSQCLLRAVAGLFDSEEFTLMLTQRRCLDACGLSDHSYD